MIAWELGTAWHARRALRQDRLAFVQGQRGSAAAGELPHSGACGGRVGARKSLLSSW